MAQIDFKVTAWERVTIDDDKLEEVIAKIKSGEISTANDLVEAYEDSYYEGVMAETTEQMTPEENDYQSTIEVLNDDSETVFTNADKFYNPNAK